jgi:hypothetical protein
MTPAGRWRRRALPWALRATLAGPKLMQGPWLRCMAQVATVPWLWPRPWGCRLLAKQQVSVSKHHLCIGLMADQDRLLLHVACPA